MGSDKGQYKGKQLSTKADEQMKALRSNSFGGIIWGVYMKYTFTVGVVLCKIVVGS